MITAHTDAGGSVCVCVCGGGCLCLTVHIKMHLNGLMVCKRVKHPHSKQSLLLLDRNGFALGSFEGLLCQDYNRWPTELPGPC